MNEAVIWIAFLQKDLASLSVLNLEMKIETVILSARLDPDYARRALPER